MVFFALAMTPAYFHDARVPRAATSLALALGITLVIACGTQEHPASLKDIHADWVGSEACRSCHPKEFEDWKGSHHALAEIALSTPRAVPTEALDGLGATRPGVRSVGVHPLVQYVVEVDGVEQVSQTAWDPDAQEWFDIFEDGREPGEWGHWSGRGMNWDSMCASCHNTNLEKKWDPATDTYATTQKEWGVGCEACHGPGGSHVDSGGTSPLATLDQSTLVGACGACHARRGELLPGQHPHLPFLDRFLPELPGLQDTWHADGQVRDENYEWASFRLSRLHTAGVTCGDCHNPHSGQIKFEGDALCMSCHVTPQGTIPPLVPEEHTHHSTDSEGARCMGCHMPETTYMQRDPRHDHSFSVPDPLLTLELGIPNACNRCHTQESAEWSLAYVDEWYGERMERPRRTNARLLAAARNAEPGAWQAILARLEEEPNATWRAVRLGALGAWPGEQGLLTPLLQALHDEEPLVRLQAARVLGPTLGMLRTQEGALGIGDDVRAVRVEAGLALGAGLQPGTPVAAEVEEFLQHNRDQPAGAAAWSTVLADRDLHAAAAQELRNALKWDPSLTVLREQLAVTLDASGDQKGAVDVLKETVRREPQRARAWYLLGLAHAGLGDTAEAEHALDRATVMEPTHVRAWFNLGMLRQQRKDLVGARLALRRAAALDPSAEEIQAALRSLSE